jgi:hypothetical protein
MEDHRVMKVAIEYISNGKKCVYYTHVMAVSTYHAIDKAHQRCSFLQEDRSKYRVVSNRSRAMAQCTGMLAMTAYNYTLNYS